MPTRLFFSCVVIALVCPLAGCKEEPDTSADPEVPTFWRDVAPIYFERCVGCHQAGGVGPFELDNYEDASAWAEASAQAVAERTMPPWLMTADGSCGEFRGSRALTPEEIEAIGAWAGAGAPEGEPRDDLKPAALPGLAEGLDLRTPEFVPEIAGGPLAQFDEYRCFVVDPGLDRDVFLTGYDVLPGNAGLVHHVLAMPVAPEHVTQSGQTNAEVMQALDAESPDRDGWPCFTEAGEGVEIEQLPVTWAPGMGAVEYPANTGVRLRAGDRVVIQIHYNLRHDTREGESDSTRVRLQLADSVEREGFFALIDLFIDTLDSEQPAEIEPGQESALYTWTVEIGEWFVAGSGAETMEVYGLFPHMHERGRKWRAELLGGDEEACIGDVQRWDFGWQLYYFYEEPLVIDADSELRVTCEYNTMGLTEPVTPGWGTQNEMCLAGLYVVP